MRACEHRAEAERLLEAAKADVRAADPEAPKAWSVALDRASIALRAAEVHARLAALDDDWRSGYRVPDSRLRMATADELMQLRPDEWGRPVEEVELP